MFRIQKSETPCQHTGRFWWRLHFGDEIVNSFYTKEKAEKFLESITREGREPFSVLPNGVKIQQVWLGDGVKPFYFTSDNKVGCHLSRENGAKSTTKHIETLHRLAMAV